MTDRSGSSTPINLQQIARQFRLTGWISFIFQIALTVVAILILGFASSSAGNSAGIALTSFGILVLFFTIYWSFRYIVIGRRLEGRPNLRPKKAETIQVLRIGLIASLAGMFVALLGQGVILGVVAGKAFRQGIGGFINTNLNQYVQPLDILIIQSTFNVVFAQFVGLAAALWLLNRMNR